MTQASGFENFLFQPDFALNLEKVTTFSENWIKNKKVRYQKIKVGVENTPSPVLLGLGKGQLAKLNKLAFVVMVATLSQQ